MANYRITIKIIDNEFNSFFQKLYDLYVYLDLTDLAIEEYLEQTRENGFKGVYKFSKETLPQFVYQAALALLWSQTEGFLDTLVKLLEQEHGPRKIHYKNRLPTINKLLEKINNYGLLIDIEPELARKIDIIRMIRNDFIHSLGANIPEYLSKEAAKSLKDIKKEGTIDFQFCLRSIETAQRFMWKVGSAFAEKYSGVKNSTIFHKDFVNLAQDFWEFDGMVKRRRVCSPCPPCPR